MIVTTYFLLPLTIIDQSLISYLFVLQLLVTCFITWQYISSIRIWCLKQALVICVVTIIKAALDVTTHILTLSPPKSNPRPVPYLIHLCASVVRNLFDHMTIYFLPQDHGKGQTPSMRLKFSQVLLDGLSGLGAQSLS